MRTVKKPCLVCAAVLELCVCVCVLNSQVPSQKLSIFCHRAGLHIPDFLLAGRTCCIVSFPWSNEPPDYGHPESHSVPNTNTHSDTHIHTVHMQSTLILQLSDQMIQQPPGIKSMDTNSHSFIHRRVHYTTRRP